MIYYDSGTWGISFIFACRGSVFPRACFWAISSAISAYVVQTNVDHSGDINTVISQAWFAMASVVGFLIVFRTQQGYSRYWEGASLLQSVKACWLNATSNLISFCTPDPELQDEAIKFQHLLVRLVSLLHCSSLQSVSYMEDNDFEIIDASGLSQDFLDHIRLHEDNKCFIVLQALQQLIVDNIRKGVIDIAPPIVSRVFQELSNGIVAVTNVRKITDIPFPFPYAQLVVVMLLTSWIATPLVCGYLMQSPYWAAALTFIGQFGFWSINYIAAEIEMPFGDDKNDLPIAEMQREMNECLRLLMNPLTKGSPGYDFDQESHRHMKPERSSRFVGADELGKRQTCCCGMAIKKRHNIFHPDKIWPTHPHLPHFEVHLPMHMPTFSKSTTKSVSDQATKSITELSGHLGFNRKSRRQKKKDSHGVQDSHGSDSDAIVATGDEASSRAVTISVGESSDEFEKANFQVASMSTVKHELSGSQAQGRPEVYVPQASSCGDGLVSRPKESVDIDIIVQNLVGDIRQVNNLSQDYQHDGLHASDLSSNIRLDQIHLAPQIGHESKDLFAQSPRHDAMENGVATPSGSASRDMHSQDNRQIKQVRIHDPSHHMNGIASASTVDYSTDAIGAVVGVSSKDLNAKRSIQFQENLSSSPEGTPSKHTL